MCQTRNMASFPVPMNVVPLKKKVGEDSDHFEVVRSVVSRDAKEFVFNVEFHKCVVYVRGNVLTGMTAVYRNECQQFLLKFEVIIDPMPGNCYVS